MTPELAIIAIVFKEFMRSGGAILVIIVGFFIGILIGIILRYKRVGIWKAKPGQEFSVLNSYRPVDEIYTLTENDILNNYKLKRFLKNLLNNLNDDDDDETADNHVFEIPKVKSISVAEMNDDMLIKEIVKDVAPFGKTQEVQEENNDVNIDDIKEALKRLGYKQIAIKNSIENVMSKEGSNKLSIEEIIINAIHYMNK